MKDYVLKGDICYSKDLKTLECVKDGYLVCINQKSMGVFESLPEEYKSLPIKDYRNHLIVPGLIDLHLHAPQFPFRGSKMDLELLDWLKENAFLEEMKYSDLEYAKKSYEIFVEAMKKSATTRACIFASKHKEATKLLCEMLEQTGLITYVGKVNMNREAPEALLDKSVEESIKETEELILFNKNLKRTKMILTPRFILSCTSNLLKELEVLQNKYQIPVQSHLSENPGEIQWVANHYKDYAFYGEGYDRFGLFGKSKTNKPVKTIMAHCVWSTKEEQDRMKENGVWVAHCPASNANLSSGIAPIRKYLDNDLRIGLGSDIGAGQTESIFRAMIDAISVSKLYWRLVDSNSKPLCFNEAFYLATMGGGSFFGNVGSFSKGYELDALVLDDSVFPHPQELSISERLERFAYLSGDLVGLKAKFVAGELVYQKK